MALLIGLVLALAISLFAYFIGLDRDRAFYATVLMVIALLYALFSAMGGSTQALLLECIGIAVFISAAVIGFKGSQWFVVAGLFGHGVYDFFHGHLFTNPGVPTWWPEFCLGYDVVAAGFLAWLIVKRGGNGEKERKRA